MADTEKAVSQHKSLAMGEKTPQETGKSGGACPTSKAVTDAKGIQAKY